MTFRDAVAGFATAFEAAMDDTVTITDPAEPTPAIYDPGTRTYSGAPGAVYTGSGLLRPRAAADVQYGEKQQVLVDYDLILPAATTGIAPGQLVTVDAVGSPTTSPLLVGQTLTVHGILPDTYNARLQVECRLNRGGVQ